MKRVSLLSTVSAGHGHIAEPAVVRHAQIAAMRLGQAEAAFTQSEVARAHGHSALARVDMAHAKAEYARYLSLVRHDTASTPISGSLTKLMLSPLVTPAAQATMAPIPYAYGPTQLETAYGLSQLANKGAGVTIGVVDEFVDPNLVADLNAYSAYYGLPQMNTTGGPSMVVKSDATYASVANSPTTGASDTSGESCA